MNTWIALLRGVNVGGHNVLPMKELKAVLESLDCVRVATYIQSGNIVFGHAEPKREILEAGIRGALSDHFGFEPDVLLLTATELEAAAASNRFPDAEQKSLHCYFLTRDPVSPDIDALQALADNGEEFDIRDRVFYLFAPGGIGRSRLASRVERLLGVSATARNWRTVSKLLEMSRPD